MLRAVALAARLELHASTATRSRRFAALRGEIVKSSAGPDPRGVLQDPAPGGVAPHLRDASTRRGCSRTCSPRPTGRSPRAASALLGSLARLDELPQRRPRRAGGPDATRPARHDAGSARRPAAPRRRAARRGRGRRGRGAPRTSPPSTWRPRWRRSARRGEPERAAVAARRRAAVAALRAARPRPPAARPAGAASPARGPPLARREARARGARPYFDDALRWLEIHGGRRRARSWRRTGGAWTWATSQPPAAARRARGARASADAPAAGHPAAVVVVAAAGPTSLRPRHREAPLRSLVVIPLRDDVPSRTFPFVNIGADRPQRARSSCSSCGMGESLEGFFYQAAVVPVALHRARPFPRAARDPARRRFSPDLGLRVLLSMFLHGGWMHLARKHALPLDLRRQRRGPHGARPVSRLLPALRLGRDLRPHLGRRRPRAFRRSAPRARSPACWAPTSCSTRRRASSRCCRSGFFSQLVQVPALFFLGFWFLQQFLFGRLQPRRPRRRGGRRRLVGAHRRLRRGLRAGGALPAPAAPARRRARRVVGRAVWAPAVRV